MRNVLYPIRAKLLITTYEENNLIFSNFSPDNYYMNYRYSDTNCIISDINRNTPRTTQKADIIKTPKKCFNKKINPAR